MKNPFLARTRRGRVDQPILGLAVGAGFHTDRVAFGKRVTFLDDNAVNAGINVVREAEGAADTIGPKDVADGVIRRDLGGNFVEAEGNSDTNVHFVGSFCCFVFFQPPALYLEY